MKLFVSLILSYNQIPRGNQKPRSKLKVSKGHLGFLTLAAFVKVPEK